VVEIEGQVRQMSNWHKVALLLVVTVVVGMMEGCSMWGKPKVDVEAMKTQAIAYMENRYGVEFVFADMHGGGVDGSDMSSSSISLTTPALVNPRIQVHVLAEAKGTGFTFKDDDFLYYKFGEIANAQAKSLVSSIIGQGISLASITKFGPDPSYPDSFGQQTTAQDFYSFLRSHSEENPAFAHGQAVVSIRILVIDTGQDLNTATNSLVSGLAGATGWGVSGEFQVPCALTLQAYSSDDYQAWVSYLSRPSQLGNYTPQAKPVRQVEVDF